MFPSTSTNSSPSIVLERKELPEHIPAGKGAEPEYILKPTRKYERITNMGDGYFSAEIGSVSTKEDILNSAGKKIRYQIIRYYTILYR